MYEMASLLNICGLCLWLYLASQSSKQVHSQNPILGTVYIDGSASIATTDEDFICATMDWWPPEKCDYGTCSWGTASLLNLDLNNKILFNAVKAFSPLKVRLGGTLQDKVIYQNAGDQKPRNQFIKSSSEMFGFTEGCLPMSRWDELNNFFKTAGAKVIFGLNALYGRSIGSDGTTIGPWNSSNAESLIRYTVQKNYTIYGWELGNELSGNGIGASVPVDQYASDVTNLHYMVQDIYRDFQIKPLVLGPGGFFDAGWFSKFISKTSNSLQAVTHHIYNLGPGVDDHLIDKILNPLYLDGGSQTFSHLQSILKNSGTSTTAWVGEAGGAYNSGRNLVTNTFVFSFWYLDQLGMSSSYDTKTYCRQTLIGGNYGLINTFTYLPNPDYYRQCSISYGSFATPLPRVLCKYFEKLKFSNIISIQVEIFPTECFKRCFFIWFPSLLHHFSCSALLWHRLMGRNVLSSFTAIKKLRAYAHCSKYTHGITVLLINLDGKTTEQVHLSVANAILNNTSMLQFRHHRKGKFEMLDFGLTMREEYHLTPKDGDIHSQTMLLNGKVLAVDSSGMIPSLQPKRVNPSDPIIVAPFSIVFVKVPTILVPACKY